MQQLCLFKEWNEKKVTRWNIDFQSSLIKDNEYITTLKIPSGKFLTKYTLKNKKIDTFEILDYSWYMYLSISMIKNIKTLVGTIIKKS